MNASAALLLQALSTLDEATLVTALHDGARAAVAALEGHARAGTLAPRRDAWALPDALWNAACVSRPHLRSFPLGESCERAFKRTVIDRLESAHGAPAADADDDAARERLAADFVARFFFETCLDRLRRPGPLARGYHFSKSGRLLSLAAEARLRARLRAQCAELAGRYVAAAATPDGRVLDDERAAQACEAACGRRPAPARPRPEARRLNVVEGRADRAALESRGFTLAARPTRLLLHERHRNVAFSFAPFESRLGRPLHSLVKDLLDLGAVVFMADQHTRRDRELGRRLGLLMSMRHPEAWAAAREPLRRMLAQLGRDEVEAHFVRQREPADPPAFRLVDDQRCVCLFSGGLDSTAGAAWLLQAGRRPVLVSHFAGGPLAGLQQRAAQALEARFATTVERVAFVTARRKDVQVVDPRRRARYKLGRPPRTVMTQHLRSFLFLAAAAAVALESGIRRVYVFENGPLALNPSICEGRVNTQTVHPHVLASFQELVRRAFGVDLVVENPFAALTKGEVVRVLAQPGLGALVAQTNSCWNFSRVRAHAEKLGCPKDVRHDGDCLPCVLRRTAVHAAGLDADDAPYLVDVFGAYPRLAPDAVLGLADLLRFCRNVLSADDDALLRQVPELSVCAPGSDPHALGAMLRRHAFEVRQGFRERANAAFRRDFASVL
jgi:7-cyano-7-deazaguanine synthase in queuosine biosynthesis